MLFATSLHYFADVYNYSNGHQIFHQQFYQLCPSYVKAAKKDNYPELSQKFRGGIVLIFFNLEPQELDL